MNTSRDTLCSIQPHYNIRVTHRNGAIKHIFFTRIRSTEGSSTELFFIHFVSLMRLSPIINSILLQIFLYRFEHVSLTYICRLYFLRMPAGPHFVAQPILLNENILNICVNHQQNTRRSDQIETIKTIMQATRPRIMEGFYQWLRLPFLKILNQVRKDLDCELFYSELKRHNVSLYLLSSHR